MRPKIVVGILASGVLLIACLMGLRAKYDGQEAQFLSDGGTSNAVEAGASQGKAAFAAHQKVVAGLPARSAQRIYASNQNRTLSTSPTPHPGPDTHSSAEDFEDAVNNRIWELSELATQSDPESFQQILRELTNQVPEIRKAALEAVIQAGTADAVPFLKDVAERSTDPKERAEIAEAIKFISLPSLADISSTTIRANPSSGAPSTRRSFFGRSSLNPPAP